MKKQNQYHQYIGYYPYSEREFKRVKKVKFGKRVLAIVSAIVLGSTAGYFIVKNFIPKGNGRMIAVEVPKEDEYYPTIPPAMETAASTTIPTAVPTVAPTATPEPIVSYDDGYNRGDSVVAIKDVNMRLDANQDSKKIGLLAGGSVVNRILSDGNWDLVRYGDQIAYVHTDYTRENEVDYNQEYYHIEEYSDIARTTSKLYFRLGPSTSEKEICLLDKDEEVVVIGKAIPFNNPDDVWYLVRARGKIGYINAGYVKSLRSSLENAGIYMDDVKIQKLGYFKKDTSVLNQNGDPYTTIKQNQLAEVLQSNGKYSLIHCDGVVGYVPSNSIKIFNGAFLVVDKSEKRVYHYYDKDVAYKGQCWVGRKSMPTQEGCFIPYGKSNHHTFPDGSEAKILWMPFNGGQGLHDYKPGESHGCVRLTDEAAQYIYDNVPQKTPVLVKE